MESQKQSIGDVESRAEAKSQQSGLHSLSKIALRCRENISGMTAAKTHKKWRKHQRIPHHFRLNAEMAIRAACGVILASFIQLRDEGYDPARANTKKWRFFPDWYYLGGLSYCAVMVVFSMGVNLGGTLREVCRGISGVGLAFAFYYVVFMFIEVEAFDSRADNPYENYYEIHKAFNSDAYWINLPNLLRTLPWMTLFTVVVLLLPFNVNTRKFALGSNAYFMLTVINPTNPLDPTELKAKGDEFFGTENIFRNLRAYSIVGVIGGFISVLTMLLPYPIIHNVEQMNFLQLRIDRKFNAIEARHRQMASLLVDTWWEQCFGVHFIIPFNRVGTGNYINLVGSLIGDLRTLHEAARLEKYGRLHSIYMKVLHREISSIQTRSVELLDEISLSVHTSSLRTALKTAQSLENQIETILYRLRKIQTRTLRTQTITVQEVAGNAPLTLFLFSLNSFCSTLIHFQHNHSTTGYDIARQVTAFMVNSLRSFLDPIYYTRRSTWLGTVKGTLGMTSGIFLAIHVYGFSATVPSTVAYVMGNYLGGSFRVTVNRVGGVVAGSVVPSVFKFFFVQLCNPSFLNELLSEMVIFLWVSMSMYVCFAGEYSSYAGLVSAFISADTLLRQTDLCYPNGSDSPGAIVISSYSSLAQTSVGVVIFILVETFIFPQSAASLLSRNIQTTVKLQQKAFDALFGYHLSSCIGMPVDTLTQVRHVLEVQIPRKLLKRTRLMGDAQAEPVLWRGPFLRHKHERVLEISHRMLNNIYLLFKLVCWFDSRVEQKRVVLSLHDIRVNQVGSRTGEDTSTQTKWHVATNHFLSSVRDRFDTIHKLYESAFWHSNPEQAAVFMQLKEAFRLADKNCTGELSAGDVSDMLEKMFSRSVDVKEGEIQKYVAEFMAVVGTSNRPTISFPEFVDAVENGLRLEVKVQHRRKSRGSDAIKSRLSSFRRSRGADGSKWWSADDNPQETRDAHRNDEVLININADDNADSTKLKASPSMQEYIEGSISRRVVDRRGSVVVEEVSLTITPNLLHLDSDDEDGNSGLTSDYKSTPLWRDHDAQNVEEFSIRDIAQRMKFAYAEWLIADNRFEQVSMEEQFLLQCLVSGAEGVAKNLTELEEVAVSL